MDLRAQLQLQAERLLGHASSLDPAAAAPLVSAAALAAHQMPPGGGDTLDNERIFAIVREASAIR